MGVIADPRPALGIEVERALLDLQLGIRALDLDRRRQHLVMQRHDSLEQARRPRGSFGVADLRFDRAQRAPLMVFASAAKRQLESGEFGDIAGLGAGAVRFNQFHRFRTKARHFIGTAQRTCLTFRERGVDAVGASVGGRADATDDRINTVAIALRIVQTLERHHGDAFAEQGAIGRIGEWAAIACRRKRRCLAEAHVHENVVHRIDAAGDDQVRLTELQFVDTHRDGGQRAGAGRVGHGVGAAQIEAVGNAAGNHIAEQAGERRFLPWHIAFGDATADFLRFGFGYAAFAQRLQPHRLLQAADHVAKQFLSRGDAQQHADTLAIHGGELPLRRVVQNLLRDDQREDLRRVGGRHDARRYAEFKRIEIHRRHEATSLGVGLVERLGIGIVIVLYQPVRRWHVGDQILAGEDVAPEAARICRSGEQGADADDGDGNLLAV